MQALGDVLCVVHGDNWALTGRLTQLLIGKAVTFDLRRKDAGGKRDGDGLVVCLK